MRLFIAINFSKEVKDILLEAIDELRSQSISGNFTRPENLHLTLAFIGESENIPAIRNVIDRCAVPAFDMTVQGAGHFGDLYWVGIENNPILKSLAEKLRTDLRASGFDIEAKAFKPHITIARQLTANKPVSISVPETSMKVSRVSLMKSERINGKLTYTEVYGKKL